MGDSATRPSGSDGVSSGSRLRLVDSVDESSIETIVVPVDGDATEVPRAELRRLRRDDLSDEVFASIASRTDGEVNGGFRGRGGLPLMVGDVELAAGPARVVLVVGELQPGRYVADLLGHVRSDAPRRWVPAGYVLIRPVTDPAAVGAVPQLNGFHDPPNRAIYSDRGYARRWKEPLPDSLRLDLFAIAEAAMATDVLSAGYLRSNGIFVSRPFVDDLHGFSVSNAHWYEATATRSDEQWHLSFLQLLPSDAVDFARSTFRIEGGDPTADRQVVQLDDLGAVDALRSELVPAEGRPSLVPDSIVMAEFPDLFAVPSTIDLAMSIRLVMALSDRRRTGIDVVEPDYLLG